MGIDTTQIKNEIVRYGNQNPLELQSAILSDDITLNKYAKPLSKVKGEWSMPMLLMNNVVQNFSNEWSELGSAVFKKKTLKNFHMKVNFPIEPYDVYGSWVEELYTEDKKPQDYPISKYIIELLKKRIVADLNVLSITGEYNVAQKGVFSAAMNGLNKVITDAVADVESPVFKVPVDASLANNIVDRVTAFERALPESGHINTIFLSLDEFNDYVVSRETPADRFIDFTEPQRTKTKFGRTLVGLPGLKKGRLIAFMEGNFFRLYDRKDNPAMIDDVQVQDYKIKVFSQWHLGYDFAVNAYLFVETQDAQAKRGLGNDELNNLYYPGLIID